MVCIFLRKLLIMKSIFKTIKEFLILTLAEIIVLIIALFINEAVFKIFNVDLSKYITDSITLMILTIIIIIGLGSFVAVKISKCDLRN
ncbi:MAG: hypothetical protein RLZZ230_218 [Candidatus Parcubacteria bacterium]